MHGNDTGQGWRHYRGALLVAQQVLFHLQILEQPPAHPQQPHPFDQRLADTAPSLRGSFIAYLDRKSGTCRPKTVSSLATRLAHFGRFLAVNHPELASLADLDRQIHIEPYLTAVARAVNSKTGQPISTADQGRRIRAVQHMLAEIAEWGWREAPGRPLVFRSEGESRLVV